MRPSTIFAGFVVPFLLLGCSSEDQLRRIEGEVSDMKLEVFKLRQQVEEANRKLDGETAAGAESRAHDRRFQADLQETLRQLQDATRIISNRLGSTPRTPAPAPRTEAPASAPAAIQDDEKAYGAAVLDYNRGSYALAAESLELFLKTHKTSPRRSDAAFFLGLSHFNQKTYDKAQAAFEQIVRDFPDSAQFLPAKLKRAQCMLRQGMKPAAVRALKELAEGFQGTPEARTAQQELDDLGL